MDVRAKLLRLIHEKNWSYYRLAKESNMSWSTIRNMFERGTEPTLPTLEALCEGLGITLADLLVGYSSVSLTDDQKELLENWEKLEAEDRQLFMELLRSFNRKHWQCK